MLSCIVTASAVRTGRQCLSQRRRQLLAGRRPCTATSAYPQRVRAGAGSLDSDAVGAVLLRRELHTCVEAPAD